MEAGKRRWDLDGLAVYVGEACGTEQSRQLVRVTKRESFAFVERSSGRIHRRCCVPEVAEELHPAAVIPHARRHGPLPRGERAHFLDRGLGIREEVQSKQRDDTIVSSWSPRQASHSGRDERNPGIPGTVSGELDEGLDRIAAYDRGRVGAAADRVCKRACATPNIQPVNAVRNTQPGDELSRKAAAPAAHEVLVG